MKLEQAIELLHRSSQRLMDALKEKRTVEWWGFMRRECWIHLKRTLETWWLVLRGKE